MKDPTVQMTNLLSSNKVLKVSGQMVITDHVNNLVAEFDYAPKPDEKESALGSLIRALTPRSRQRPTTDLNPIKDRSDYFRLRIYEVKTNGDKVLQSEGDGTFLSYIQIDSKVYWKLEDEGI